MDIKKSILFFASITLLLLIIESCRSAKFLDDDQSLVTKIEFAGAPKNLKEEVSQYVSNEIRPNSALNLTIYNIFNTRNGAYKKDKIREVGEMPRILDTSLVELSALQIKRFFNTKGYFNATVTPEVIVKNKKAKVSFLIDTNEVFRIGELKADFAYVDLKNIYQNSVKPRALIKQGDRYDVVKLVNLRENIYHATRNHGYYDFLRQYIRFAVDTNKVKNQADLILKVDNPDHVSPKIYYVDDVSVTIRNDDNSKTASLKVNTDTTYGISFQDLTGKFRAKTLSRYVFLRPGKMYRVDDENTSYDRLYELSSFRSVKINIEKVDSAKIDVKYELIPRAVMSNQLEGEYTFSSGMSGFNIGNTFSHRNIFGGSETLELKLRYGVLFDPRLTGNLSDKIFNNDFQVGVNIVFPRLLTPFAISSSGRYGLARTTFSSSLQLFNQDNTYSNRYLINTLNYSWWQNANLQHSYTPLVVEYRQGKFDPYFEQSLINEGYRLYVESNNRQYFGLGSQYSVIWNAPMLQKLANFSFIRGSLDISGNTLGLLNKVFNFKENPSGQNTLFGVTYLQYVKGELDYRLYRHLGGNKQFVFRFNGGVAIPYGNNSELLIFEKSFFAGGMNGIRAWQARTLGPGNYNRETLPESLRLNLRNLDQLGEIKLETNFEYRFRLMNNFFGAKLNGATFMDMGNVWSIRSNEVNKATGVFKADKLLSQIAIGSGFGLRFDMDYFMIRLDAGFKMKDPQFVGNEQWVVKHWFNSKDFRKSYNDLHRPDRYNIVQYNFGVGLPF